MCEKYNIHITMKFFKYDHLPEHLQSISKTFCELAHHVNDNLVDDREKYECLRRLLEAKDCAVRSLVSC